MDSPTTIPPKIEIGMGIAEAERLGGPYVYGLKRDKKWGPGTTPLTIIDAQKVSPDDTEITMFFANKSQFDTVEPANFIVKIEHGRVSRIDRLTSAPK